jgi:hypothetical protein
MSTGSLPNHELNNATVDQRHSRQQRVYPGATFQRPGRLDHRARPGREHPDRHLESDTQRDSAGSA